MLISPLLTEAMSHVVIYSFGLGTLSTVRLSETVKACSFSYEYDFLSGSSFSFVDGSFEDSSPERVFSNVCKLRGSKVVVLIYRQELGMSDEGLLTFLRRLTQLFTPATNTKLCVCFPIPNPARPRGSEDARSQALRLLALAEQSRGRLKVLELYSAAKSDSAVTIPGISCQTPHQITQGGCRQLAALVLQEIANKLTRRCKR